MSTILLYVIALATVWAGAPVALAQQGAVRAEAGSVAIGGSVRDSTITIGISPEQLDALIRDRTRLLEKYSTSLERELDLNRGQVGAALRILGEANVPPEQLTAKLIEVAERFRELEARAAAQPDDDPKVIALKADAQKAIEAGELQRAHDLLKRASEIEGAALLEAQRKADARALRSAETNATLGQLELTRLRYHEAAKQFATAAARVPSGREDMRLSYLDLEADALYLQGAENSDPTAATSAIERCRQVLALRPREQVPLDWAMTQIRLGGALQTLGARESDPKKLEQAVEAYQLALLEYTRERFPLQWAMTQNNWGNALWVLGERQNNSEMLHAAVQALRLALLEHTRERVPLRWAMTQTNMGLVLQSLGERESGTEKLEEAVQAYRLALLEHTRERFPLQWAMTQNNLSLVLQSLGQRESGTEKLEDAVHGLRLALLEHPRERLPRQWATVQNNLGLALQSLGAREHGTTRLEEAVQAYRLALLERTRERVPLDWA